MNDVYFELLKVRLERSKRNLAERYTDLNDNAFMRSLQATLIDAQNWIGAQRGQNTSREKQIETLRLVRDLYFTIKKSWRWKIGNKSVDFLMALARKSSGNNNAFDKLEKLILDPEWNTWIEKPTLDPFHYATHAAQFMDEVCFESTGPVVQDKVSIIILNRNGKENLERLFHSFLEWNTYINYQFILVDHDSNDGSLELVNSFQDRIKINTIPLNENFTYSYSNNLAAEFADGEYLFFLNNDILFDQDVIGSLVEVLKNDPLTGLVTPVLYYPDAGHNRTDNIQHSGIQFTYRQKNLDGMEISRTAPPRFRMHNYKNSLFFRDTVIPVNLAVPDEGISPHAALCAAALLCRRADFTRAGGFNENYLYGFEDVDLSLVFRTVMGKKAVVLNSSGMIHDESFTRKKEGYFKAALKIHNLLTLTYRFGYHIRENHQRALFMGDKTFTDQIPLLAILVEYTQGEQGYYFLQREMISKIVKDMLGWGLNFIEAKNEAYDLKGVDAVLAPDVSRHFKIENAKDSLLWIGIKDNGEPVFDFTREYPIEGGAEKPVHKDDPFRTFLIRMLDERFSVTIKSPLDTANGPEGKVHGLINNIESSLQGVGITVKTESPDEWYSSGTISSHAVISFSEGPVYYPQPGQINVLWVSGKPSETVNGFIAFYDMIVLENDDLSWHLQGLSFKGKIIALKKPGTEQPGKVTWPSLHPDDMDGIVHGLKEIHSHRSSGCSLMD